MPVRILREFLKSWYHDFCLYRQQLRWRALNSHNHTVIENNFSFENIVVGNHTYGPLTVYRWGSAGEGMKIGHFCSVAKGVKFILGGNHHLDTISTYPFPYYFGSEAIVAVTKGPIVVEDDVWIGTDATILSGIRIGRGAVVAAGSMVTKDVAPYAIVGGNPAKEINRRFTPEIIEIISAVDYGKMNEGSVRAHLADLSERLGNSDSAYIRKICSTLY